VDSGDSPTKLGLYYAQAVSRFDGESKSRPLPLTQTVRLLKRGHMQNYKLFTVVFVVLLTACTLANNQTELPKTAIPPTETSFPTQTSAPTLTPTPTAVGTPTPVPLDNVEGTLFFDYNGNGLRDENEPPIPNFGVCIKSKDICATTDKDGHFSFISIAPEGANISLSFVDPNATNPALAFRYINRWLNEMKLPAYEKDGIKVPEQRLNDISISELSNGFIAKARSNVSIGLTQGFLTLPFDHKSWFFIYNWVDLNPEKGAVHNYNGITRVSTFHQDVVNQPLAVLDGHDGIDFAVKNGTKVYASIPGEVIDISTFEPDNGRILIRTRIGAKEYKVNYGHVAKFLVGSGDKIRKGQVIAIIGKTTELHFQVLTLPSQNEPCKYFGFPSRPDDYHPEETPRLDPYRDEQNPICVSYWTVDNNPQYAISENPQP